MPSDQTLAFIGWVHARRESQTRRGRFFSNCWSERRFVSPALCACLYMGLGNADEGFRYAEMAREQQDSSLIFARVMAPWDPFRNDPRYLKLLTEIGLSDEQIQKNQHQQ